MKSEDAIFLLKLLAAEAKDYDHDTPELTSRAFDAIEAVVVNLIEAYEDHEKGGHPMWYPCPVCRVINDSKEGA